MQLYVVRHGIAIGREDPKCPPDAERYLTEEGVEKTREVAKGVAALGATADLFLSSPYVRAMQTAEIFAGVFGIHAASWHQFEKRHRGQYCFDIFWPAIFGRKNFDQLCAGFISIQDFGWGKSAA